MTARRAGKMTVEEAGRKGGEATSTTHGRGFYEQIGQKGGAVRRGQLGHEGYSALGRKGGQATNVKHGPGFYAEIGRKGGEAVSRNREHMSQIGRKGGAARAERGGELRTRERQSSKENSECPEASAASHPPTCKSISQAFLTPPARTTSSRRRAATARRTRSWTPSGGFRRTSFEAHMRCSEPMATSRDAARTMGGSHPVYCVTRDWVCHG